MFFVVLSFCAVFVLVAGGGLLLSRGDNGVRRMREVIKSAPEQTGLLQSIHAGADSLTSAIGKFEQLLPRSKSEVNVVRQRLIRAGLREESALKIFYGTKVVLPALFGLISATSGLADLGPIFIYPVALAGGFLLPDYWLGRRITQRQAKIRRGLPDVIDLLVVCVEAGLSLDQSTARTAEELRNVQPELCDELGLMVLEQRAGRPRADAWRNLAERTGEQSIRNIVSTLVQGDQLGTGVAKTLRVHSESLRKQRVQYVEEMAAKTSVKLVFPLVFFIFPALFVVTLGPAGIMMVQAFSKLLNH